MKTRLSQLFCLVISIAALVLGAPAQANKLVDLEVGSKKYTTVLSIAGSDPSGGAGIQADLKTFSSLECYGMSVITALTAQNTTGVQAIQSLPKEFVGAQLRSIFDDIEVDAIKIGMLERKEIIVEIAKYLKKMQKNVVVDPVMYAKSGDQIIQDEAIDALKEYILPLATILTPNIHEASRLLGESRISSNEEMERAAFALLELGPQAVIIKGGALKDQSRGINTSIKDCLVIKGDPTPYWLEHSYVDTNNIHGTGCTFSAAIASYLARGEDLLSAVKKAVAHISFAIEEGAKYKIGKGRGPVYHLHAYQGATNFTQKAWQATKPVYFQIKKHPFITELATGLLPQEKFSFYVEQDYLFLRARAEAFAILASRISKPELAEYLASLAERSTRGAEHIFEKYGLKAPADQELRKSAACALYTSYMLDLANHASPSEGIVALLPCALIYQEIGEYIRPLSPPHNHYQLWIDTYSNLARRKEVEKFISVVDNLAAEASDDEVQKLATVFYQASEHEYNFWDSAYGQQD